ncbi:MAG: sugar transferase [Candidatus Omnitrophica bacterium]|nr:sugar transferase [Candidatus Omnitrophota bacterium]
MSFLNPYLSLKRTFDFSLAALGGMFFLPLAAFFAFLIWFEDKGPVYFSQVRVGKDGVIFNNFKFRSMKPDAENGLGPVQAKENDPRVTSVGKFLRKTAMDELPQLINILRGDMSFVGPRALRPVEKELTSDGKVRDIFDIPGFAERSKVKPGLTGFAQVYASRKLIREEKFKYDLWYIDHMNFWLDIKLIIQSVANTLRAKWDI